MRIARVIWWWFHGWARVLKSPAFWGLTAMNGQRSAWCSRCLLILPSRWMVMGKFKIDFFFVFKRKKNLQNLWIWF